MFPLLSVACPPSSRAAFMFPVTVHAPWTWARSSCVLEISSIAPTATPTGIAKRELFMSAPPETPAPNRGFLLGFLDTFNIPDGEAQWVRDARSDHLAAR